MAKKFEQILGECLERVVNRGEEIEQCLKTYPEAAEELEPLLRTALAVRDKAASIQPRAGFKSLARQRLLREVYAKEQKRREAWRFPLLEWQRRWAVMVATVLIIVLAGGGTTVAASTNSVPGDLLYSVKIATENVRLALTQSEVDRAELEAKFADRRVSEIARMAEEGNVAKVEVAAERLAKHMERIGRVAAAQKAKLSVKEKNIAKLKALLTEQACKHPAILRKAMEKVPGETKATIRKILNISQKRYVAAIQDVSIVARAKEEHQLAEGIRTKTFSGIIRLITEGQWLVGGEVINIDAGTAIEGIPRVGMIAEVTVQVQPDGSLLAQRIEVQARRAWIETK